MGRTSLVGEAVLQREIVNLLRLVGCAVYVTSQGYRRDPGGTRMTPGLPDLLVLHDETAWTFVEVKTAKGKIRPSQMEFAAYAAECRVPCEVWRSVDDAKRWLVAHGIVEAA